MPKRKPDPEWDEVHQSNYRNALLNPRKWIQRADDLLNASVLLEPEIEVTWETLQGWRKDPHDVMLKSEGIFGIYFMLAAFALENLFKAALVDMHRWKYDQHFKQKGTLPTHLNSHNLFELAKAVRLTPPIHDEDVLRRLTRAAVWYARYPVPKEFREISPRAEFADGKAYSVSYFSRSDVSRVKAYVRRLQEKLGVAESA
jgi:hypothetical protein